FLKSGIAISLISQIVSLPILLTSFYEFSLISFLLNIIYVPLYSIFILPLSFLTYIIILLFPKLSGLFVSILTVLLEYPNDFAVWMNGFDLFTIVLGKPPTSIFILFFISIIICFIFYEKDKFAKKKLLLLTIFLCP